jgi:hypothetical protein
MQLSHPFRFLPLQHYRVQFLTLEFAQQTQQGFDQCEIDACVMRNFSYSIHATEPHTELRPIIDIRRVHSTLGVRPIVKEATMSACRIRSRIPGRIRAKCPWLRLNVSPTVSEERLHEHRIRSIVRTLSNNVELGVKHVDVNPSNGSITVKYDVDAPQGNENAIIMHLTGAFGRAEQLVKAPQRTKPRKPSKLIDEEEGHITLGVKDVASLGIIALTIEVVLKLSK